MKDLWQLAKEPVAKLRGYRRAHLKWDVGAGLTVGLFAIPQSIAYAAIAGLPPAYGLYTAAIGAVVAGLWGSSRHLNTGPTNALSILTASVLAGVIAADVGEPDYLVAASVLAILTGLFCVAFAVVKLGFLASFASRSVLLGFTAGAGLLIILGQLRHVFAIGPAPAREPFAQAANLVSHLAETDPVSFAFGAGTIVVTLALQRISRRIPAALLALVLAGAVVAVCGPELLDIALLGGIDRALPSFEPASLLALFDREVGRPLIGGALAVAAVGAIEAVSIAREAARRSGDRQDVNQELFGQGLANLACGFFGGYPCSGSFARTAINQQAGARTPVASVVAAAGIVAGVLFLGDLGRFLPRASIAGIIVIVALRMIDWRAIRRVAAASPTESSIVLATFAATLLVPLDVAVLIGVLISLAVFVYQTSMPRVVPVVPDPTFRHLEPKREQPDCPQLAIVRLHGSLYFGATTHIEDELLALNEHSPGQTTLLLNLSGVDRCDLSGVELLEGLSHLLRAQGGDLYLTQARTPVLEVMRRFGFIEQLGEDHFLPSEEAIQHLFETHVDPAVCCYECEHRVFAECQAVPSYDYGHNLPSLHLSVGDPVVHLSVEDFELGVVEAGAGARVIDVREPTEFEGGHLPGAELVPLRELVERSAAWDKGRPLFLVCRSGRRSRRAGAWLIANGFAQVSNLAGGILSWRGKGRPVVLGGA